MNKDEKTHVDGTYTEYYSEGKKKSKQTWKDGKLNGHSVSWNRDGKKTKEGNYTNGAMHGKWRFWNYLTNVKTIETWIDGNDVSYHKEINRHGRTIFEVGRGIESKGLYKEFEKEKRFGEKRFYNEVHNIFSNGEKREANHKVSFLEQHKLSLIGGESRDTKIKRGVVDYLHVSDEGYKYEEFIQLYYKDLCKLNDYIYITLQAADKYAKTSNNMEFNYTEEDSEHDKMRALHDRFRYSYFNDEISYLYAPASCLTLLYFFTISHLKDLNINYNLDEYYEYLNTKKYKQKLIKEYNQTYKKNPSEFEQLVILLDYLKLQIGANKSEQTRSCIELIVIINEIRNKYAHGEFQELKVLMQEINIRETLVNISLFFEEIHNAIINATGDKNSPLFDSSYLG